MSASLYGRCRTRCLRFFDGGRVTATRRFEVDLPVASDHHVAGWALSENSKRQRRRPLDSAPDRLVTLDMLSLQLVVEILVHKMTHVAAFIVQLPCRRNGKEPMTA